MPPMCRDTFVNYKFMEVLQVKHFSIIIPNALIRDACFPKRI